MGEGSLDQAETRRTGQAQAVCGLWLCWGKASQPSLALPASRMLLPQGNESFPPEQVPVALVGSSSWLSHGGGSCFYPILQRGK